MPSKDIKLEDLPSPSSTSDVDSLPSPDVDNLPSPTSTSSIPGVGEAAFRGYEKGATFGLEPQLAGVGAGALEAAMPGAQGRSWNDIVNAYQQMKQQEQQKNLAAQKAHPIVSGVAGLAGTIPTSVAAGAAGAGATLQGGGMGLGSYLGQTANPTAMGALKSTTIGAGMGQMASVLGPAVGEELKATGSALAGKVGNLLSPEMYKAGQEGIDITSPEAQQNIIPSQASKDANNIVGRIVNVRNSLGQDISNTINTAAQNGKTINLNDELQGYSDEVQKNLDAGEITQDEADRLNKAINFQLFQEEPQAAQQIGTIKQTQKFAPGQTGMVPTSSTSTTKMQGVSPEDLQSVQEPEDIIPETATEEQPTGQISDVTSGRGTLLGRTVQTSSKLIQPQTEGVTRGDVPVDQAYQAYNRFKDLTSAFYDKDGTSPTAKILAQEIAGKIKNSLSQAVPDFAQKMQTYDLYNRYLPETIMAKGEDPTMAEVRFGDTNKAQLKLKQATENLLTNLNKTGTVSKDAKQTFNQLADSLDQLNTYDRALQSQAEIEGTPYTSIFNKLGLNRDEILSYLQNQSKRAAAYDNFMQNNQVDLHIPTTFMGALGKYGSQVAAKAGNQIGLWNMPDDALTAVGTKLSADPQVSNLGRSLVDAVQNGDTIKQNAAIFAILQNPRAKAILDPDLKEQTKSTTTPTATAPTGPTRYSF